MQALGGALTNSNKRMAQVDEPAPSEEDPSALNSLLLPTTYQAKVDTLGGGGAGIAAATGEQNSCDDQHFDCMSCVLLVCWCCVSLDQDTARTVL